MSDGKQQPEGGVMLGHHIGNPNYADLSAFRMKPSRRKSRWRRYGAKMSRTARKVRLDREARA
jgi:hypothetical protein